MGFLTRGDCATVALGPCILKRERDKERLVLYCVGLVPWTTAEEEFDNCKITIDKGNP